MSENQHEFSLLREEAVDSDLFECKTHDRTAATLLDMVNNQEGGVRPGRTLRGCGADSEGSRRGRFDEKAKSRARALCTAENVLMGTL